MLLGSSRHPRDRNVPERDGGGRRDALWKLYEEQGRSSFRSPRLICAAVQPRVLPAASCLGTSCSGGARPAPGPRVPSLSVPEQASGQRWSAQRGRKDPGSCYISQASRVMQRGGSWGVALPDESSRTKPAACCHHHPVGRADPGALARPRPSADSRSASFSRRRGPFRW